jgi:predicted NBD/HSP70 family sugar kinase
MPTERALGIAVGSRRLVVALVPTGDPDNAVCLPTRFAGTAEAAVREARKLVAKTRDRDSHAAPRFAAVGAAVPGQVDHKRGVVVFGPDLVSKDHSWRDVDLGTKLESEFDAPAVIENDVNAMAGYQQELALGRDERSFVVVYLAPGMAGVGSGIVVDGKIIRGCSGGAGEFGHLVVQPGGPRCVCDNRGCLQALIGVDTIVRTVNWGGRDLIHAHATETKRLAEAARLAEEGDARAVDAFRHAGRWFGQGLSSLVNLLNPPLTIIGGPEEIVGPVESEPPAAVMRSAELFREGYEETLRDYSFAQLERSCRIMIDSLNVERAAVGAALLAMRAQETPEPEPEEAPLGTLTPA